MKIYATDRVTKELTDNKNQEFLSSFQKAINVIRNTVTHNTLNSNIKIQKLSPSEQPIYSFRIDNLSRLIFTITKDEKNEDAITLLDIAIHDNNMGFVSGSTMN
jgi:Txe/YoeB family toxin of Txe-Axe toxin-antitoxin module